MNKKMKKFIKILKNLNLSQKEKDVLRYKIEQFISFNPIRGEVHVPKKSFYFSIFTLRSLGKAMALVLIILTVVGGTGVSYASTDALPGDKLYNVKINVNEKIEEKLAFTTEAKVTVQTQKVERRLTEVQKLVEKKDFSDEKKEIVKINLEKNVNEVTKSIESLKNEGKIEEALDTTSKITPVLEAHKKVLTEQKIKEVTDSTDSEVELKSATLLEARIADSDTDSLLESVDAAIKKVEDAEKSVIDEVNEDQVIAKEVTDKNTEEVSKKIESLKKENIEIDLKEKQDQEEKEVSENKLEEETTEVAEGQLMKAEVKAEADVNLKPEVISSETDAELKVKEAEVFLLQAEQAKTSGKFREALMLSQEAKKIISQIEEYKKIKSVESTSAIKNTTETQTKVDTNTKGIVVPTEKSPTATTTPSSELKTEIKPIDIKAEAIKSLEETNPSLKKINLIQSTQNHLPL